MVPTHPPQPAGVHRAAACTGSLLRLLAGSALTLALVAGALPSQRGAFAEPARGGALTAQTILPQRGVPLGATDPRRMLQVSVALKVNDPTALNTFIQQLYNPASPTYKQYLTPAEFTSRFIDSGVRVRTDLFLRSQGLTVLDSGLGSLVHATGTVAQMENAFHVRIGDYRAADGRVFYANDRTPALPIGLAGSIQEVTGLSSFPTMYPKVVHPTPVRRASPIPSTAAGCAGATNIAQNYSGYTPNQFATAYNFPGVGNTGTGQTVALFELDNYADGNVQTFQTCFGTHVPVARVNVDGGFGAPAGGQGEVELDIEVIIGQVPGITKLLVYNAPQSGNDDEYQQIANDDTAKVVSTSWGNCEAVDGADEAATENTIFAQMATQGQTFFDASGDNGSAGCYGSGSTDTELSIDVGTGSPNVTGVGGTTLNLTANNAIATETAWNEFASGGGSSGGGVSVFQARPSWQTGPGTTRYSTTKRQAPDIAADADPNTGYIIYSVDPTNCPTYSGTPGATSCWEPSGGTSAAAPLWAAGAAAINEYLAQHNKPRLGWANPALYAVFNSESYSSALHDVTVGSNCYVAGSPAPGGTDCGTPGSNTGKYQAGQGYDPVTGVGTPNFGNLATALAGGQTTTQVTWSFAQNWNVISLPLQPTTALDARTLLSALPANTNGVAALYALNGTTWTLLGRDHQGTFSGPNAPLQLGAGYLLYTDQAASYTVTGTVPTPPNWVVRQGWNLVGLPQQAGPLPDSQSVETTLLKQTGGTIVALYGLSNAASWSPSQRDVSGAFTGSDFPLQVGKGYLLYSDSPTPPPAPGNVAPAPPFTGSARRWSPNQASIAFPSLPLPPG